MADGIKSGQFSSRELVSACLDRADAVNGRINAMTEIRADEALAAADAADQAVAGGEELGLLHGVPMSIKGNVDVAGWATVNGCAALRDNIATETSPCARNWLDAGAILIGRTNTPEFCCRWETDHEVYGATVNPWNPEITAGGSSGGAAASVAVAMTPLAQGTDLGGSLRQPAQACGVASIRPGMGRVPIRVASEPEPTMGSQLMNVHGPMARRVADVRLGLQAMARGSWEDPGWVPAPLDMAASQLPVAVVVDPLGQGVHDQVASGVRQAGKLLEDAGYRVDAAEPEDLADAVQLWKTICIGELLEGLEPTVRDFCSSALRRAFDHYRQAIPGWTTESYIEAFAHRHAVLRGWLAFFQRYSVLVAPISTQPPLGVNQDLASPEATLAAMESMRLTVAINAMGLPAAVVPVGVQDGLPQAVQVIGPPFSEMSCLAVAEAIEQQVESHTPIDPR
jgi:amidase